MSNGVLPAVELLLVPTTVSVGSKDRVSSDLAQVYARLQDMPRERRRWNCTSSALYVEKSFESSTFNPPEYCGNGMKKNGWLAEIAVTFWLTPFTACRRVPSVDARAPTEFSESCEANRRRIIAEGVSPGFSRESLLSTLLITADSPPALMVLNASRKPLEKICA